MAVPFYLPDQDEQGASGTSGSSSGSSPNTTTSATQTPLPSPGPVNGEQLVQAFMEVLYRCSTSSTSTAGSPGFLFPPPSPLCSAHSPGGVYGDEVFFPRNRSMPRSPRSSFHEEGSFFRNPIPTPSRSMRNQTEQVARRSRLTSTGEDDNEAHSEHETSWDELDERYEQYMAARERLQEFPGRVPPRKKKKDVKKPKEQSFTWPTVVTVFVFAVGCGFLVAR